jgi:probable phosphoglycerate mutase
VAPTLVLVRHGQTALNASGRLQGRRVDEPLTDVGRRQAAAAAAVAVAAGPGTVARVVTSPLLRARETAAAIAAAVGGGIEPVVDERWTELDYGEYDGLPFGEVPPSVWDAWRTDTSFAPPGGGESLSALATRVWSACEELASSSASLGAGGAGGDGTVVVVSHVSPIKAAVAWALGVGVEASWRMFLDVASICRVSVGARGPSLVTYNERPVLPG